MNCHVSCGSVVASCCFECPLEACIYKSGGHGVARLREVQIAALPELSREKVAVKVGCSVRTVYRSRKRVR